MWAEGAILSHAVYRLLPFASLLTLKIVLKQNRKSTICLPEAGLGCLEHTCPVQKPLVQTAIHSLLSVSNHYQVSLITKYSHHFLQHNQTLIHSGNKTTSLCLPHTDQLPACRFPLVYAGRGSNPRKATNKLKLIIYE